MLAVISAPPRRRIVYIERRRPAGYRSFALLQWTGRGGGAISKDTAGPEIVEFVRNRPLDPIRQEEVAVPPTWCRAWGKNPPARLFRSSVLSIDPVSYATPTFRPFPGSSPSFEGTNVVWAAPCCASAHLAFASHSWPLFAMKGPSENRSETVFQFGSCAGEDSHGR